MSKGQPEWRDQDYLAVRFAEQMRAAMFDLDLKQVDMVELTGVSLATINRMYNARRDNRGTGSLKMWGIVFDALGIEVGFRAAKPLDKSA